MPQHDPQVQQRYAYVCVRSVPPTSHQAVVKRACSPPTTAPGESGWAGAACKYHSVPFTTVCHSLGCARQCSGTNKLPPSHGMREHHPTRHWWSSCRTGTGKPPLPSSLSSHRRPRANPNTTARTVAEERLEPLTQLRGGLGGKGTDCDRKAVGLRRAFSTRMSAT